MGVMYLRHLTLSRARLSSLKTRCWEPRAYSIGFRNFPSLSQCSSARWLLQTAARDGSTTGADSSADPTHRN